LLTLGGEWFQCKAQRVNDGPLWLSEASKGIVGGMSGSPIVDKNGAAIGIVCTGSSSGVKDDYCCTEGGPNPSLSRNLPGWLLHDVGLVKPVVRSVRHKAALDAKLAPKGE
jgi:hypothetical protein